MALGVTALGQSALGQFPAVAQTLIPSLVTNTSVFYSPTAVYDQALTQSATAGNASVFYAPTVAAIIAIRPPLLANTSVFYRTVAWGERSRQSETWIERTRQSETWTRAA